MEKEVLRTKDDNKDTNKSTGHAQTSRYDRPLQESARVPRCASSATNKAPGRHLHALEVYYSDRSMLSLEAHSKI